MTPLWAAIAPEETRDILFVIDPTAMWVHLRWLFHFCEFGHIIINKPLF